MFTEGKILFILQKKRLFWDYPEKLEAWLLSVYSGVFLQQISVSICQPNISLTAPPLPPGASGPKFPSPLHRGGHGARVAEANMPSSSTPGSAVASCPRRINRRSSEKPDPDIQRER